VARRFRTVLRDQDLVARRAAMSSRSACSTSASTSSQHGGAKAARHLNEPIYIDGHDLRVGGSIGISVYPQDGNDAETLLLLADIAMYRAKQEGGADGDHVAFYSQDMNQGMQERMRIETGRNALGNGELLLHYQPKYAIEDGKIIGAEALVRWRHPQRGLVPPSEFIPLAEATGLVVQVGEWVLETACAQAQVGCGPAADPAGRERVGARIHGQRCRAAWPTP
jgi:predicted signal transduction protein with EAL and GGDEF domain